ncbi:MAG: carbon-nitrogen hydrolase family protein [Propionicimonas sp.]|uniref:carbon-nitrogen hydrolase family protein n=1 Tax=Propionicimonas sp. TaxID=1955623 RepID=UPI002B220382|nr:carbon-nitrogen hydrolase family protein [Propionicimonas sp.]MEA4945715.1 carbon-nitrogen hydrolase family protein [Propionicimonas sp.]MEA5117240.1 carbon-nitrogen hydrolase family protein [Propionicimonas sp.]
MRIALAQLSSSTDPAANLGLVRRYVAEASDAGAELVVFPEATMHSFDRSPVEAAEPLDGPWASSVRSVAAEHGTTIVAGMFTTTASRRVRNTLLVTGAVEASYDKLHLFDALGYAESDTIQAGDGPAVVELGGVRIGLATCYDIRFPALFTRLAELGAQVVVVPASWASGPNKVHQWRTLACARAMDSTCFVVACDQAEPAVVSRKPTGVGHSLVADPYGSVLRELGSAPELAVVDVDLSLVVEARERMPVLRNARRFPPGA